jgi:hypothetical protein
MPRRAADVVDDDRRAPPRQLHGVEPAQAPAGTGHHHGWIQSLTEQFLDQPASLTDLEALSETLLDFASKQAAGRRSLVLYERAVASSPTLRGRVQERVQADITTVATAVAERRGQPAADEGCALLAAVVLLTYRRALTRWLQGPANGNLRRVVADEFALLVAQVAPSAATANGAA